LKRPGRADKTGWGNIRVELGWANNRDKLGQRQRQDRPSWQLRRTELIMKTSKAKPIVEMDWSKSTTNSIWLDYQHMGSYVHFTCVVLWVICNVIFIVRENVEQVQTKEHLARPLPVFSWTVIL